MFNNIKEWFKKRKRIDPKDLEQWDVRAWTYPFPSNQELFRMGIERNIDSCINEMIKEAIRTAVSSQYNVAVSGDLKQVVHDEVAKILTPERIKKEIMKITKLETRRY